MTWRQHAGGQVTTVTDNFVRNTLRAAGKTPAQALALMRSLKQQSPSWNPLPPVIRMRAGLEFSWRNETGRRARA